MSESSRKFRVSNDTLDDAEELRRDMLEVIEQGGWLMPGTDPMDGIADPAKGCAKGDPEYTDVTAKSTS